MIPRIYVDTSVIGGCEDKEFQRFSRGLMRQFEKGFSILVLSDMTLQELEF